VTRAQYRVTAVRRRYLLLALVGLLLGVGWALNEHRYERCLERGHRIQLTVDPADFPHTEGIKAFNEQPLDCSRRPF
jgi:hypothetical protein